MSQSRKRISEKQKVMFVFFKPMNSSLFNPYFVVYSLLCLREYLRFLIFFIAIKMPKRSLVHMKKGILK